MNFRKAALALLFALWLASPASGAEDSTDLALRFTREYPEAADRLRTAVMQIKGAGRFYAVVGRESVAAPDERDWIPFHFVRNGPYVRWHQNETPDQEEVNVLSPDVSFTGLHPNSPKARVKYFGPTPLTVVTRNFESHFWRFLEATYLWSYAPLADRLATGHFVIERARADASNPELVLIDFRFRNPDAAPESHDAYDCSGTLTFSPEQDWALRAFDWQSSLGYRISGQLTVARLPSVGVLPQVVDYRYWTRPPQSTDEPASSSAEAWVPQEEYRCEFDALEFASAPPSEFTFAAAGFKDPRAVPRQRVSTLVWVNVIFVAALCVIFVVRWRRSRNGSTSA